MITFLTVFLGLFSGVHTVELTAEPPVAHVELLLDGRMADFDRGPTYDFQVDFGDELAPHRLTAIGYDAEGEEVARATRDVNVIPRVSGLEIAIEYSDRGGTEAVRLSWDEVERTPPERLELWLDGQPLASVARAGRVPEVVPLPDLDLVDVHFVTADLYFPNGTVARAERVFGGELGAEIGSDNTPVAVEVDGRRKLRERDQAAGLVRVGEAEAEVLAIERGPADLVIVRSRSGYHEIQTLTAGLLNSHFDSLAFGDWEEDRFFHLAPAPRLYFGSAGDRSVFPASPVLPGSKANLIYWLAEEDFDPEPSSDQVLPDAVAMAGMMAASAARSRIVLLVLGPEAPAISPEDALRIRRFLERLQVPLEVWYVERSPGALTRRERLEAQERREAAAAAGEPPPTRDELVAAAREAWGDGVVDVDTLSDLTDAARDLRERVARQRILWIDGDHLPTDVALAPGAEVRLAGSSNTG